MKKIISTFLIGTTFLFAGNSCNSTVASNFQQIKMNLAPELAKLENELEKLAEQIEESNRLKDLEREYLTKILEKRVVTLALNDKKIHNLNQTVKLLDNTDELNTLNKKMELNKLKFDLLKTKTVLDKSLENSAIQQGLR